MMLGDSNEGLKVSLDGPIDLTASPEDENNAAYTDHASDDDFDFDGSDNEENDDFDFDERDNEEDDDGETGPAFDDDFDNTTIDSDGNRKGKRKATFTRRKYESAYKVYKVSEIEAMMESDIRMLAELLALPKDVCKAL